MWGIDWQLIAEQSPWWVLMAVFVVSLVESIAVVGVIVPGMVFLTVLASAGSWAQISSGQLVFSAFMGALVGDVLSYFAGTWGKQRFWQLNFVQRDPYWLVQGVSFFERWGWLGIFIGRFLGPLRPVLPLVAGIFGMPKGHFLLVALAACSSWAVVIILPAYHLGQWAGQLPQQWITLLLSALIISLLVVGSFLLLSKLELKPYRYGALCVLIFLLMALGLSVYPQFLAEFDQKLWFELQNLRLKEMLSILTRLGDFQVVAILAGFSAVILTIKVSWQLSLYWLCHLVFTSQAISVLKKAIGKLRPERGMSLPDGAMPSGHAWIISFLVLSVLLWFPWRSSRAPKLWLAWGAVAIVTVCISRWYLGFHWVSDLLVGLSLGCLQALLGLSGLGFLKPYLPVREPIDGLNPVLCVLMILFWCLLVIFFHFGLSNLSSH